MKAHLAILLFATVAQASGCAGMGSFGGGPDYGETSGTVANQTDRDGHITDLQTVQVDDDYKFGIGTVIGAVAGGLLGSQVGSGTTATVATVAGAAAGAAAGTYAESKLNKIDAQQVTVQMRTGGQVIVVQPEDTRFTDGMSVRIEGSGETGRVVPR